MIIMYFTKMFVFNYPDTIELSGHNQFVPLQRACHFDVVDPVMLIVAPFEYELQAGRLPMAKVAGAALNTFQELFELARSCIIVPICISIGIPGTRVV